MLPLLLVSSAFSGIAVTTGPRGDVGITTVVSNPSGSGKVLKINTLVAASIGNTTGVALQHYDNQIILEALTTVSTMTKASVPTFSSLVVISKENSVYLLENTFFGIFSQPNTGRDYRRSLFIRRNCARGG